MQPWVFTLFGLMSISFAQQPFIFGQSSALSGPSRDLGINMRDGSQAAFRSLNDAGGIYGRNLTLISLDDEYEAVLALNQTQKLLAANVIALLSYCGTPTTTAALNLSIPAGVPMLAPFTGARALRTPMSRYVINTRAGYDDEIFAFVKYCLSRSKTLFSIFYQNNSFGLAGLSALELALSNQNLKVISQGTFPANTVSVEKGLAAITNVSITPEVIIMVGTARPLAKFVSLAKKVYPEAIFHSLSFLGSEEFLVGLQEFNVTSENVTKDLFVTQVFPIPQPLAKLKNASQLENYLLLDYAKAMSVHCPLCPLTFGSLEGYIAGMLAGSVLQRMGELDSTSLPFRRYLDDYNVSRFNLTQPGSLRAVREYMLDTLFNMEIVNVGGLRLGPYVQPSKCKINQIDCIQPAGEACSQGMHNVFLTQPDLVNGSYRELLDWRVSWSSCTINLANVSSSRLPLVFGQTAALSGHSARLGLDAQAGIRAAFNVVNVGTEGGVRARKLLLMSFDDYGVPSQAQLNARHMVDVQNIIATLATTRSSTSNAIASLLSNSSTPFVGPLSGNRRFQEQAGVINVRPGFDDEVAALVSYGFEQGWKKYSILYEQSSFGEAGFNALSLALQWHRSSMHSYGNFPVPLSVESSPPPHDFELAFHNLTIHLGQNEGGESFPDVVVVFADYLTTAAFTAFAEANSSWAAANVKYMCGSLVGLEVLRSLLPPALLASGRVFVSAVVPLHDFTANITQNYLQSLSLFNNTTQPTFASMEGYVIGRLVLWGLQRAVETTSNGLKSEIFNTKSFALDNLSLGPYSKNCTMGLRTVWVLRLASSDSLQEVSEFRAQTHNEFAEDCGAFSIYSDPPCQRGYRKVYESDSSLQAHCEICLNTLGCDIPLFVEDEARRIVLLSFNVMGFACAFVAMVIVLFFRNSVTLRAASARFCALILVGAMFAHLTIIVLYQHVAEQNCMVQVYLFNTAFSFFFGALFTKIYRITRIFGESKRFRKIVALKDSFLFVVVIVLWVAEMAFTVAWHVVDPMVPTEYPTLEYVGILCLSSNNTWGLLNILANGLFLVYGIVLTVQSRNTPTAFNESRHLAATLYNAFIFGAIFIGLAFVETNDDTMYMCKALSVLLIVFIGNLFLFGPKFWILYQEVVKKQAPKIETSGGNTSLNNSSMKNYSPPHSDRDTGTSTGTATIENEPLPL